MTRIRFRYHPPGEIAMARGLALSITHDRQYPIAQTQIIQLATVNRGGVNSVRPDPSEENK